ncbi:MAG: acetyltransferase [Labilithrix sp.]|nr:acetyltransferase [Labilithrix sp.]MCW5814732.1 acetyltransferase [Labilithrix sp.]
MKRELVVVGGGEHARVVIEAAQLSGQWSVVGYTDVAAVVETSERLGVRWLGDDDAYVASGSGAAVVLGIGLTIGRPATSRLRALGCYRDATLAAVIHPSAVVSPTATIAPGAVILARAVVNSGARIGAHAIVNTGAIVEHDVAVGVHVHLGPGVVIGGGAEIGDHAQVALGACVRDHVRVGREAVVAMGTVVVRDVADGERVAGVPGRPFNAG